MLGESVARAAVSSHLCIASYMYTRPVLPATAAAALRPQSLGVGGGVEAERESE